MVKQYSGVKAGRSASPSLPYSGFCGSVRALTPGTGAALWLNLWLCAFWRNMRQHEWERRGVVRHTAHTLMVMHTNTR